MTVSVILCSLNPDPRLLDSALASLARQTIDGFEVVIVDNGSQPPLDSAALAARHPLNLRVLREERPGLIQARCAGIAATTASLLVFVDDDNALDQDYLERAVEIAVREPSIGHFGGISQAGLTEPVPDWKRALLPHLGVRDHGQSEITSAKESWGPWEPIGAGMVTRRAVADAYVQFVSERLAALRLGRRGNALMSGEDALMARIAVRAGYSCSYQPGLKLTHSINPGRLHVNALARTVQGHGRSYVVLERLLGRCLDRPDLSWMFSQLIKRLAFRVKSEGLRAGTISWFWDVGFMRQARLPE